MKCSYVMGIGEAEAFSERLKRELLALEAANVHAILESEPLVEEVCPQRLNFVYEFIVVSLLQSPFPFHSWSVLYFVKFYLVDFLKIKLFH